MYKTEEFLLEKCGENIAREAHDIIDKDVREEMLLILGSLKHRIENGEDPVKTIANIMTNI